jgi:hypothetical protein
LNCGYNILSVDFCLWISSDHEINSSLGSCLQWQV